MGDGVTEKARLSPDKQNKRARPTTGDVPQHTVRLTAEIMTALDRWRDGRTDMAVGRSAAMRCIIIDRLTADGYLPIRDDPEMAG